MDGHSIHPGTASKRSARQAGKKVDRSGKLVRLVTVSRNKIYASARLVKVGAFFFSLLEVVLERQGNRR